MDEYAKHLEIIGYEAKAEELIRHNIQKYKYVGEEGREYDVIQTVFHEINRLRELSNKQIRWYAVIIALKDSFYNRRLRGSLPDFPSLEYTGAFKMSTEIKKEKTRPFFVPPYIEFIESYINEIARLGVLVSTKEKISANYLDFKFHHLPSTDVSVGAYGEEAFLLTLKNASENAIKLAAYFPGDLAKRRLKSLTSEISKKFALEKIDTFTDKKLAALYNMDDFWNGFIP